jgi:hypothetical protein
MPRTRPYIDWLLLQLPFGLGVQSGIVVFVMFR